MATVYFMDGFDHRDYTNGVALKYTDNSRFNQGSTESGRWPALTLPTVPVNGRLDSGSMRFINSAFNFICYTKTLTPRSRYVVGFNYKFANNTGTTAADHIIFRWETGTPVFLTNANTATSMSIRSGPTNQWRIYGGGSGINSTPGTLVATIPYTFVHGSWYFVEIDCTFGPGGRLAVYVEGTLVYLDGNVNLGSSTTADRFSLRLENFGTKTHSYDDLYVADEPLGPSRVTTTLPVEDILDEWTPTPAGNSYETVDDRLFTASALQSSDGDTTRIDAAAPGLTDLYRFATPSCVGRIWAVAVNATSKKSAGGAPKTKLVARYDPLSATVTEIAESDALTTSYATFHSVINLSPLTGDYWTDAELAAVYWGVRSGGSNAQRVSHMFVEKLISLEGHDYQCGGGSNSYAY